MTKIHIGRKFVAFILCLITLVVMGIIGKGVEMAPYIIGLFTVYATGNVVQKATNKTDREDEDVKGGSSNGDER